MPRVAASDVPAHVTRSGSILVIDDEDIMREILEALLAREGYDVRLAANALEGLELVRSVPFDAAIVDMMMPGMDGISALDEIKKIDDDLPVLMITAFASVENAIAAMKAPGSERPTQRARSHVPTPASARCSARRYPSARCTGTATDSQLGG